MTIVYEGGDIAAEVELLNKRVKDNEAVDTVMKAVRQVNAVTSSVTAVSSWNAASKAFGPVYSATATRAI